MPQAPIIEAIRLVRSAIVPALIARSSGVGVYWLEKADNATYPFVVVQSQDAGGRSDPTVGACAWHGLITVKAVARSSGSANGNALAAAEALIAALAPGMDALTPPTGYAIGARYARPLVLPPVDGVWQAAALWDVRLERTS